MRRRTLIVMGLVFLVLTVVAFRVSQGSPSMPPGVTSEMWRPISDAAGIKILPGPRVSQSDAIVGTPMVREGTRWRTVALVSGTSPVIPAQ
jgi:hypothetical protein